ncbi:MAG: ABC transporter permease, partial [Verrucomicrobia bacterium]|nr:ABC transporter permease [Verrucomicrobiota bacterium]
MSSPNLKPKVVSKPPDFPRREHLAPFAAHLHAWLRKMLKQREASVFLMLLLVSIYLSLSSPYFLETRNLLNVGRQFSVVGIVAIGEALVIIAGAIDLSVGSVVGLASVTAALVTKNSTSPSIGLMAGLGAGLLTGLINGLLFTRLKINPFIATLGMLSIARGAALLITGG